MKLRKFKSVRDAITDGLLFGALSNAEKTIVNNVKHMLQHELEPLLHNRDPKVVEAVTRIWRKLFDEEDPE